MSATEVVVPQGEYAAAGLVRVAAMPHRGEWGHVKADDEKSAKRDRVQREREQRRATELRTNLKRRKAKARAESGMKTCAGVTPDEERIEPQES